MAATRKNFVIAPVSMISIGDYVAAAGAGSLTDLGYTESPISLENAFENHEVTADQTLGAHRAPPTKMSVKLKFIMKESLLENWRIALRQAAAQKTGTTPNFILAVADPVEQYHQVAFVTKAVEGPTGTKGTRTITVWRGVVESVEAVAFGKDSEQLLSVTLACLYDDTVTTPTTAGTYYKVVDTLIA